jgi:hypothetical protein
MTPETTNGNQVKEHQAEVALEVHAQLADEPHAGNFGHQARGERPSAAPLQDPVDQFDQLTS